MAVLAHAEAVGDAAKQSLWAEAQRALARERDPTVLFSLLAALGTALYNDKALTKAAVAGGVREVLARFELAALGDKIVSLTHEIVGNIADNER